MALLKVYVVVGVMGGIIEDIDAYLTPESAARREEKLCKAYGVPYDQAEREKYYEQFESENEVLNFTLDVHD